jgi:hypothetical protein
MLPYVERLKSMVLRDYLGVSLALVVHGTTTMNQFLPEKVLVVVITLKKYIPKLALADPKC